MTTMISPQKGARWTNEAGEEIPRKYIKKFQIADEKRAYRLYSKAAKIQQQLIEFKAELLEAVEESYQEHLAHRDLEPTATGGHSIISFDKSIKISRKRATKFSFDPTLLEGAQRKFEDFVERKLGKLDRSLSKLVLSAFVKRGGSLDPKKILALHRYRDAIDDPQFSSALDMLTEATDSNLTKHYIQIYRRNDEGEYESVPLNIAAL